MSVMSSLISSAKWSQRSCSYPSYPDHGHPTPFAGSRPLLDWSHWWSASQKSRPTNYISLHHFGTHRFGDTKQRNLLLQRPCSSLFRRSLSHIAPHLSLLCGVSGIQSSSRNAHFCKAGAFLFSAACAMFAQFCQSKVHKGVGNLENLKCNWMCSMTSWMFQQVKCETCEGAMCHLLSRNKWTRNSSVTIVTTRKSSSMTLFLIT